MCKSYVQAERYFVVTRGQCARMAFYRYKSEMQLEFFEVPSPCVGVCQSDEKGYCLGCMRTRDERQNWQALDSDKKQKVIQEQ